MPYSRPAAIVQAIHDSTQFWNPHTLGYLFLAETKRLWELEVSESLSLTTVEAALILQIVMNENGLDRVGLSYMLQALLIAKEIDLFQKPKWSANEELTKARAVTAWRFFNWQSMYCYYFFRTSFLDRPPNIALPDPMKYPEWYEYNCLLLQLRRLQYAIQIKDPSAFAIFKQKFDRIASEARTSVETVLRLYYMRHSFEVHNTFSVWIQVFVGNLAVEALKYARIDGSGDSTMIDVHRSTLVLCALGLHSQGLSYQLGKLSFRALQVCMAPEDLQLVRTYCTPGEEAEQSLLLQHTQSLWPLPITNINDNPDTALLNGFLREYQDLDLDTDGKSRSSNVSGGM
ncbi:C6 transcription factor [Pyrenophora tritici-repentis]|nr:C6 transcription factor [Pyrenophora tritici-repentis]